MLSQNNKSSNSSLSFICSSPDPQFNPFNYRNWRTKTIKSQFTQIPNVLLGSYEDETYIPGLLAELSECDLKVLFCYLRMTLGYHQTSFRMSSTKLQKLCGVSNKKFHLTLNKLEGLKLIERQHINNQVNIWHLVIEGNILWPSLPHPEDRRLTYDMRLNSKNWTPVSNEFLGGWKSKHPVTKQSQKDVESGKIIELSGAEIKLALVLFRFTIGYRKLTHNFKSKDNLSLVAGISRKSIERIYKHSQVKFIYNNTHEYALLYEPYDRPDDLPSNQKTIRWKLADFDIGIQKPLKRHIS